MTRSDPASCSAVAGSAALAAAVMLSTALVMLGLMQSPLRAPSTERVEKAVCAGRLKGKAPTRELLSRRAGVRTEKCIKITKA